IHPMLVVDEDAWRALADADALRKFERDLAIFCSATRPDIKLVAKRFQQLLAPAQHTSKAAAHPEPSPAERVLLGSKEAVKAHRVVNLSRAEVQQRGNFPHGLQGHTAQLVLDDMQSRQGHRLLARIAS